MSWWIGLDRAAFTKQCADEQERMQMSYFGQRLSLVTAEIPDRRTQARPSHWIPALNQPGEIRMGELAS